MRGATTIANRSRMTFIAQHASLSLIHAWRSHTRTHIGSQRIPVTPFSNNPPVRPHSPSGHPRSPYTAPRYTPPPQSPSPSATVTPTSTVTPACGPAWRRVPGHDEPPREIPLDASAVSSTDIWSVGYYQSPESSDHPMTEHWNGTAWSFVPSPDPSGGGYSFLYGVVAIASDDVWPLVPQARTTRKLSR